MPTLGELALLLNIVSQEMTVYTAWPVRRSPSDQPTTIADVPVGKLLLLLLADTTTPRGRERWDVSVRKALVSESREGSAETSARASTFGVPHASQVHCEF